MYGRNWLLFRGVIDFNGNVFSLFIGKQCSERSVKDKPYSRKINFKLVKTLQIVCLCLTFQKVHDGLIKIENHIMESVCQGRRCSTHFLWKVNLFYFDKGRISLAGKVSCTFIYRFSYQFRKVGRIPLENSLLNQQFYINHAFQSFGKASIIWHYFINCPCWKVSWSPKIKKLCFQSANIFVYPFSQNGLRRLDYYTTYYKSFNR